MSNMLLLTEALVPPARGYLDLSAGNPRPMDSPAVGVSSRKGGRLSGRTSGDGTATITFRARPSDDVVCNYIDK